MILRNGVSEVVDELACKSHEEADTRIFAHLGCCLQTFGQLTESLYIHATDTDIIILPCYYLLFLEGLQETWILMNDKYMPIHDLLSLLSIEYDTDSKEMSGTHLATYVRSSCDIATHTARNLQHEHNSENCKVISDIKLKITRED